MKHVDLVALDKLVEQGKLSKKSHPSLDLWIYNYTPETHNEQFWVPLTIMARGLIVNSKGTIIGKPLDKFFNLEEYNGIFPSEEIEITEKKDGCLIIVTRYKKQLVVASRGSFTSIYAKKAEEFLRKKLRDLSIIQEGVTYLFEYICPESHVVINYGDEEQLYLITVINNRRNKELSYDKICQLGDLYPIVPKYQSHNMDFFDLKKLDLKNKEGFVVKFTGQSGLRLKIKFKTYIRLHWLMTELNAKKVWKKLIAKESVDEWLINVPDSFKVWIQTLVAEFEKRYKDIEDECKKKFEELNKYIEDDFPGFVQSKGKTDLRKALAHKINTFEHSDIVFMMIDEIDYFETLYKKIKPHGQEMTFWNLMNNVEE